MTESTFQSHVGALHTLPSLWEKDDLIQYETVRCIYYVLFQLHYPVQLYPNIIVST